MIVMVQDHADVLTETRISYEYLEDHGLPELGTRLLNQVYNVYDVTHVTSTCYISLHRVYMYISLLHWLVYIDVTR